MKTRPFLFLFGVLLVSCAQASAPPAEGKAASAIVKGSASDASQDATVLVMHYDALAKGGGAASGCSGSLLAPRLVLTARHCVADTDPAAACGSDGSPISGGAVTADRQPSAMYVFAGKDRPDFLSGKAQLARGQEILTTGAKTLCDNDIALILLDAPLPGGKITPIRLDSPPVKGEVVTVVGWGITDDDSNPKSRMQRTGVTILDVGPDDGIGPKEFRTGEGTCSGDSGGPAIAPSGAVLGALSRGGNGTGDTGFDSCVGATNIYSSVAGHADLIRSAYAKAGMEPWLEGQPNPLLAKIGEPCAADTDCGTALCDPDRKVCADDCSVAACASGFTCVTAAPRKVCRPDADDAYDGCTIASGATQSASTGAFGAFALAVIFACSRRKK